MDPNSSSNASSNVGGIGFGKGGDDGRTNSIASSQAAHQISSGNNAKKIVSPAKTQSTTTTNSNNVHSSGRSKSLASSSSIAAANESLMRSSLTKQASRPSLVLRASNNVDSKEFHNNIVRSIQQRSINNTNNNKRACLPGNSVGMRIFDSSVGNTSKSEVVRRLQHHYSANMADLNSQNKSSKGMPTSSKQQQPTINIISNPNFEHAPRQPSTSIEVSQTINAGDALDTSTPLTNEGNMKPVKPKRSGTSLSSSLRRLITITFSRNTASSASTSKSFNSPFDPDTNASSSKSTKIKRNKQQRDKTSLYKNESKRRQHLASASKGSNSSAQSSSNQTNSDNNLSNTNDISKRSSYVGTMPFLEAASTSNTNTNTNTATDGEEFASTGLRRQTISDTDDRAPKDGSINQPPPPYASGVVQSDSNIECPLCVLLVSEASTPYLAGCRHRVCLECMQRYITTEINHSRLNITCPICSEPIHPNTIKDILQNEKYYLKYESFMLRRVLAAEPDARWCPAPDCGYVVLANGCASCPRLDCGREGCNTSFCYHCKQEWHPNQTCSAASIQRNKHLINAYNVNDLIEESAQSPPNRKSSKSSQSNSIRADNIKECPVCASRIIKMNDGSCNHMTCSICETEFCWLCMKEISDLHYFSPSGCTFWGKKPWSLKKKLLWQLGMLVGAPICIILIAGIAVPTIVIGIPVWAARKLHSRLERKPFSRYSKNAIITGGVLLSFVVSPIISAVALAIGIPILLGYVYGVVPFSLCRSSGLCLSTAPSLENLQHEIQAAHNVSIQARDGISIDTAMSHKLGDPSIGETSLYMSNISLETNSIGHVTNVEREDRESASNAALAGSIISQTADDGHSTRALAGSIISKESGYTLIPAEVHSSLNQAGNYQMTMDPINLIKSPHRKSVVRVAGTSS